MDDVFGHDYELVLASQTDQVLGGSGAAGNLLERVIIIPTTTAAGAVAIKDGSGSSFNVFDGGGTTALSDLKPIVVQLSMRSTSGAWKVTTGANVRALCVGKFL